MSCVWYSCCDFDVWERLYYSFRMARLFYLPYARHDMSSGRGKRYTRLCDSMYFLVLVSFILPQFPLSYFFSPFA